MGLKEIEDLVLYESTCRRDSTPKSFKKYVELIEKAEETRSDKVDEPTTPITGWEPSEEEIVVRAVTICYAYGSSLAWSSLGMPEKERWINAARKELRLEHEAVKRVQMQLDQAEQVIVDVANLVEEAGISRDLDVVDMVKALISDANSQSKRLETAIDAAVANAKEAEEQAEKLDYTAMEGYGDCDNCVSVDVNGRDEPCDLCVHPDPNDPERTEDNWRPKAEESSALEPSEVEARAKTLVSVLPGDGSWDSIGNQRRQAWRIVARETFRLEHEAVQKAIALYRNQLWDILNEFEKGNDGTFGPPPLNAIDDALDLDDCICLAGEMINGLAEKFEIKRTAVYDAGRKNSDLEIERDEAIARAKAAEEQIGDLQGEASEAWHQLREATTERDGFQDQRDSSRAMISKLEKKIAILKKDCDNRVSKSVYERSEALVVELQSRLNTVLETAQKCADKALVSPPVVLPVVHKDSIEGAMKRRVEFKERNGEEKPPVKHSGR